MIAAKLMELRRELAAVCAGCGRDPSAVRLIAVTKTQPPAALRDLAAAGQLVYGENRADHLESMSAQAPPKASFHFIGQLQSRQFKRIVPLVDCIHSLDRPAHVTKLDHQCAEHERRLTVFCQVNTAAEPQKGGCSPEELPGLLEAIAQAPWLSCSGLMCMAPDLALPEVDDGTVRRCFDDCRELAEQHGLERLSMGMSGDWQLAVAAGATDIRVGSALFR